MIDRRTVINGGFLAGLAGWPAAGQQSRSTAQGDGDTLVTMAIDDLNDSVKRGLDTSPELARVREQQRAFLKLNQKFPDVIDIGIAVWEAVYDWHVRHQQPLVVARNAEGRYTMTVAFTALVLRPDVAETYVGIGMDVR